jgi:hypothetical protein
VAAQESHEAAYPAQRHGEEDPGVVAVAPGAMADVTLVRRDAGATGHRYRVLALEPEESTVAAEIEMYELRARIFVTHGCVCSR